MSMTQGMLDLLKQLYDNHQAGRRTHRSAGHKSSRAALFRRGYICESINPSGEDDPNYLVLTSKGYREAQRRYERLDQAL